MKYKVVTEGEELEVWATGFFGFYGKNKAQVLINKGYYHRFMFENDKHKKLIVVEDK
jgi:hypothetical protein